MSAATNRLRLILVSVTLAAVLMTARPGGAVVRSTPGGFIVEHELVLPGSPESVFDAATGDIGAWWDHSFSESPKKLYIEPKVGGGFYEIFDDAGNGALHATVTGCQRGKMLRFVGPLGLAGNAILMSHTYTFEPIGPDSTRLSLSVHASGEIQDGWPETVDAVWRHFLFERFQPYVASLENAKN
jgi:hypothetical protein